MVRSRYSEIHTVVEIVLVVSALVGVLSTLADQFFLDTCSYQERRETFGRLLFLDPAAAEWRPDLLESKSVEVSFLDSWRKPIDMPHASVMYLRKLADQ